jgi:peptidoglycan/LPS O-acetylase OafA/YrhL
MQQRPFHLGYRPALDGLRGISILAVLGFHAEIAGLRGGFLGVDIFFVLSGFLITALLCEEWMRDGSVSLKGFYIRRARRLLPALLVMLALYAAAMAVLHRHDDILYPLRSAALVLLYVANWAMMFDVTSIQYHLGHTWSLSIEEQFYLIWPFLLLWMFRRRVSRRGVLRVVGLGIVASVVVHLVLWADGAPFRRAYYGLDTRAFSLLVGCAIGLMAAWGMLPRAGRAVGPLRAAAYLSLATLALLVATSTFGVVYPADWIYLAASVAAGAIVVALMALPGDPLARALAWSPLVWIGRLSYSLYLWHFPVFALSYKSFPRERYGLLAVALPTAVTFAVAAASYYLIERRFHRRVVRSA